MKKHIDLRKQIEDRRSALESRLVTEADGKGVGTGAMDNETVRAKLRELDEILQPGWGTLDDKTAAKLQKWLEEDTNK